MIYEYVDFFVPDADDEVLLKAENRIGLILYAAKRAYRSGGDEGRKFRYLREISDLWAARGWNPHDKRIILEAVNYLLNLKDSDYSRQTVKYVENLNLTKEDSEMYVSVFERVYKAEGRAEGKTEGRAEGEREKAKEIAKNMLAHGISPDVVAEIAGLSIDDIRPLMN